MAGRNAVIIAPMAYDIPTDLDMLKRIEGEITKRANIYGAASKQFEPVVMALLVINDSQAWKLHVDEETGEPLYKSFRAYVQSFDWPRTVERLYQLMATKRRELIAAREENPEQIVAGIDYDWEPRARSANVLTFAKFAQSSRNAIQRVVDDVETKAHNTSETGRQDALSIAEDLQNAVELVLATLDEHLDRIAAAKAEAKEQAKADRAAAKAAASADSEAGADEDEDDDDDDDSDDTLA